MPQDQTRENAASLEALATAHFKRKFTKAEQNLLESAPREDLVERRVVLGKLTDPATDPSQQRSGTRTAKSPPNSFAGSVLTRRRRSGSTQGGSISKAPRLRVR
jgi:hypothetical protein